MIEKLNASAADFDAVLKAKLTAAQEADPDVTKTVTDIIHAIRTQGDTALLAYTNQLDHRNANLAELEIEPAALQQAKAELTPKLRQSLEHAAQRIRSFHQRQKQTTWQYQDEDGNILGQQITPLDRVGVYVPGGKAAYPSSVLMNVIPAQIAGVSEIIMVVPTPNNERNHLVLAAAAIAGITRAFSIGGAQAVAALAYGTDLVPKVDKIVGPGNIYVATAKRQVFGTVGIDMIAGPSEVVIIADSSAQPDWVVMDLFAQAEHDEEARSILITPDADLIERVEERIVALLPTMERAEIIKQALASNGALIKAADLNEAAKVANQIAPEHLQLAVAEPEPLLTKIRHAGAIFIGHYAAEALGDYCAGPNHVLPTAGTARFSSPLGVYDFQKHSSLIKCHRESVAKIATTAATLAHGEGLTAHARSAKYRNRDGE